MNDGHKHTHYLSQVQAQQLADVFALSEILNRPLNRMLTVHWEQGGVRNKAHKQQKALLKLAGDFLRVRAAARTGQAEPPYYAWVFENPVNADCDRAGLHSHIAMHVSDADWPDFWPRVQPWVGSILGGRPPPGMVDCKTCLDWGNDNFLWNGLAGTFRYFVKGVEPRYANLWKPWKVEAQGEIIGKRCGYSESLRLANLTWTKLVFPQWSNISISGPELRSLHLVRYAIPRCLPGQPDHCVTLKQPSRGGA